MKPPAAAASVEDLYCDDELGSGQAALATLPHMMLVAATARHATTQTDHLFLSALQGGEAGVESSDSFEEQVGEGVQGEGAEVQDFNTVDGGGWEGEGEDDGGEDEKEEEEEKEEFSNFAGEIKDGGKEEDDQGEEVKGWQPEGGGDEAGDQVAAEDGQGELTEGFRTVGDEAWGEEEVSGGSYGEEQEESAVDIEPEVEEGGDEEAAEYDVEESDTVDPEEDITEGGFKSSQGATEENEAEEGKNIPQEEQLLEKGDSEDSKEKEEKSNVDWHFKTANEGDQEEKTDDWGETVLEEEATNTENETYGEEGLPNDGINHGCCGDDADEEVTRKEDEEQGTDLENKWEVGARCVARWEEEEEGDGCWYRAEVEALLPSSTGAAARVVFTDFGNRWELASIEGSIT